MKDSCDLLFSTVLSEYAEYEQEPYGPLHDDATVITGSGLSDDADHARKLARTRHYERQKSREKTPALKRGTSRTDLKRQLSKQLSRQVCPYQSMLVS